MIEFSKYFSFSRGFSLNLGLKYWQKSLETPRERRYPWKILIVPCNTTKRVNKSALGEGGCIRKGDHGEAIYQVFKLWFVKMKYYPFCKILHYLSAIILINSVYIILECKKLGRFFQSASGSHCAYWTEEMYQFWQLKNNIYCVSK